MLPLLGALTFEAIESGVIANIIRYGLLTLGFSLVSNQLKELKEEKEEKKDVFTSKPQTDVFASSSSVSSKSGASSPVSSSASVPSSSSVSSTPSTSEATEEGESEGYASSDDSLPSVSVEGSSLIDVLRSSGENTASNIQAVATSIGALRGELRGIRSSIDGLGSVLKEGRQAQSQTQNVIYQQELINTLKGIGAVLGGIGLGLEAIRLQLANGVNVELPKEVKESSIATKKVMDKLTEKVSVNPEQAITEGTPIDFLVHSAGIQSKTFADVNSFDLDNDLPDWPNDIDISKIFEFLKVSQQIQNNQT